MCAPRLRTGAGVGAATRVNAGRTGARVWREAGQVGMDSCDVKRLGSARRLPACEFEPQTEQPARQPPYQSKESVVPDRGHVSDTVPSRCATRLQNAGFVVPYSPSATSLAERGLSHPMSDIWPAQAESVRERIRLRA